LIPAADTAITILLVDIDRDEGRTDSEDGYTMGYFWAKDNHTNEPGSNKRLMFYLDAPLFAKQDGTWDITDPYPAEQVSTLAHEFQHMIHFYQKNILNKGTPETWLNEMCSLAAEDFVADKLKVSGPRGIGLDASSNFIYTSTSGNSTDVVTTGASRIYWFNYYADNSLTDWDDDKGTTYPVAYAFGAYLARNYGGAELFRKIAQSAYGGMDAVTLAIKQIDDSEPDWKELLSRWGTAVLLSDKDSVPATTNYKLNRSDGSPPGAFASEIGGKEYLLGSINHFIYPSKDIADTYDPGPFLWGTDKYPDLPESLKPVSNTYVFAGNASGTFSETIVLPPGVRLTIIFKE
jgi:hypothetical protein